ncbi:hypothetical protein Tco_0449738 [Tanacetum coccineum]
MAPKRLLLNVEVEEHSWDLLYEPLAIKAAMTSIWCNLTVLLIIHHPGKSASSKRSLCLKSHQKLDKRFDEERIKIKRFGYAQNLDEPCVYQKASGSNVNSLLYVDEIISWDDPIRVYKTIGTKSQTGYVFILNGGAVDWKSSKQSNHCNVEQNRIHSCRQKCHGSSLFIYAMNQNNNLSDPFPKGSYPNREALLTMPGNRLHNSEVIGDIGDIREATSTRNTRNEGCVSTGFTDVIPMQNTTTTPMCEPSKGDDRMRKVIDGPDVAVASPISSPIGNVPKNGGE